VIADALYFQLHALGNSQACLEYPSNLSQHPGFPDDRDWHLKEGNVALTDTRSEARKRAREDDE
jgi:hypothetical protein